MLQRHLSLTVSRSLQPHFLSSSTGRCWEMVQPKKGSPQAAAQPRRSERTRKSVPKTTVQASRVSKATPSRVTKPSRKGNPPASQPALHVGDAVPLDALEAKVTTDDGKKTSLGEQLEESGPGGLIVFVYPRADDDGESNKPIRDPRSHYPTPCNFSIAAGAIFPLRSRPTIMPVANATFPLLT